MFPFCDKIRTMLEQCWYPELESERSTTKDRNRNRGRWDTVEKNVENPRPVQLAQSSSTNGNMSTYGNAIKGGAGTVPLKRRFPR